jgi:hypothetical protein
MTGDVPIRSMNMVVTTIRTNDTKEKLEILQLPCVDLYSVGKQKVGDAI